MASSKTPLSRAAALRCWFTKLRIGEKLLANPAIHRVVLTHDAGGGDRRPSRCRELAVGLGVQLEVIGLSRKRDEAAVANAQGKLPFTGIDVQSSQSSTEDFDDRRQMANQAGLSLQLGGQLRPVLRAEEDRLGDAVGSVRAACGIDEAGPGNRHRTPLNCTVRILHADDRAL